MWLGQVALARGRPEAARLLLREAVFALVLADIGGELFLAHLALAEAWALSGDVEQATQALADARAVECPGFRLYGPYVLLAQAWVAVAGGETSRAANLALAAADDAASMGMSVYEAIALHTAWRFGSSHGVSGRLAALAAGADSPLITAYSAHAAASTVDELVVVAERFVELGMSLLAAEAYTQAAAMEESAGRRVAQASRATKLLATCPGARTPITASLVLPPELTRREREVAGLAARGLPNRTIAELLSISVRTVETHLATAYGKLKITSRAELAEALAASRR
jgi:DNA-binding NarL/FixJ family response regulator